MTQITEIAPDIYRISTFIPEANLQFNQFLVRDEQPLLFHTGMKGAVSGRAGRRGDATSAHHQPVDRLQSFEAA